jgi:hypothetical protein
MYANSVYGPAAIVPRVSAALARIARTFGITAPFWFGFVGSALLVTILWRQFAHIEHAGDPEPDIAPEPAPAT